jgi:biotin carboxyl carrier protein
MEHTIAAPTAGRVTSVNVTVGEQVGAEQVLAVIAAD